MRAKRRQNKFRRQREATPAPAAEDDFKRQLVEHFATLPGQQQVIGNYLLEHLSELPFLSVPELSAACGVSEATIVRFAQRLGYDGFSGLKASLANDLRNRVVKSHELPPRAEQLAKEQGADALQAVARQEVINIEHTLDDVDRRVLGAAAATMFKADHVFTFGLGVSSFLAELLAYLLVQVGVRSTPLSNRFSSPLEQLGTLHRSDVLVLFSFPPYSKRTIELARQAHQDEIPTIAICDRPTAPVAKDAAHVLPVRSDNMMYTNAIGAVSVLLNGLTTEIALRHHDYAARAAARITEVLARDDSLLSHRRVPNG